MSTLPHAQTSQATKMVQPTAELRWNIIWVGADHQVAKTLQQAWSVTQFEGGRPVSQSTEWRDVPQNFDPGLGY